MTVVDPSLQVIYDTVVKPDKEAIDYNTRYVLHKLFAFETVEHSKYSSCEVLAWELSLESRVTLFSFNSFIHSKPLIGYLLKLCRHCC